MIAENFRAYFEAFTGSASWEDLEPHFERVFHDDLSVKTANGELDREGWKESVKLLLAAGTTVKIDSIRFDGQSLFYSAVITKADGTVMKPMSKAAVQDGKLVRVEPINKLEYTIIAGSN